jgi:hypothetical protein
MRSFLSEIEIALLILADPKTPPESTAARDKIASLINEINLLQTSLVPQDQNPLIPEEKLDLLKAKRY